MTTYHCNECFESNWLVILTQRHYTSAGRSEVIISYTLHNICMYIYCTLWMIIQVYHCIHTIHTSVVVSFLVSFIVSLLVSLQTGYTTVRPSFQTEYVKTTWYLYNGVQETNISRVLLHLACSIHACWELCFLVHYKHTRRQIMPPLG